MSLHRSLKSANTMKRHRSVLSRLERVQILQEKGRLNFSEGSVLGLPKVKHLKIRIRKEKAATTAEWAAGAAGAPAGGAAPAAGSAPARAAAPAAEGAAKAGAKPKQ